MKRTKIVSIITVLGILSILIVYLTSCNTKPRGNAAEGVRWFRMNRCNGCHGEGGSGGRAPAIASTKLCFDQFLHKIRSPNSAVMPTFTPERVSDSDAADIYLWLRQQKKGLERVSGNQVY